MTSPRRSYRGCKEWIESGNRLNTSSDTACKMFDAAMSQLMTFTEDPCVGGLEGCVKEMLKADPEFVLGHCVAIAANLTGNRRVLPTEALFSAIENLKALAAKKCLTEAETRHVKSVLQLAEGDVYSSMESLDNILIDNPYDIMAIRNFFKQSFFSGELTYFRDVMSRVVNEWKPDMVYYGNLFGIYAFGMEETHHYDKATKLAEKALSLNPSDIYATHTLSHVMEMEGRPDEGLKILKASEQDWVVCDFLSCHVYWHWGLFNIEKGEYEQSLDQYDGEIFPRFSKSKSYFEMADCTSMLFRLNMEGFDVGGRWKDLREQIDCHNDSLQNSFTDPHLLMAYLGAKDSPAAQAFIETVHTSIADNWGGKRTWMTSDLVLPLTEAMVAYDNGEFDKATDLVYPIRYKLFNLGGSNAQRDVFSLFLIHCALQSNKIQHQRLAKQLLAERKSLRENTPMTDRLMEKYLTQH